MVFNGSPECSSCKSNESQMWQRGPNEEVLCISCFKNLSLKAESDTSDLTDSSKSNIDIKKDPDDCESAARNLRDEDENDDRERELKVNLDKKESKKKSRKGRSGNKSNIPKGKSRRFIFKKNVSKSPVAVSTPVTSDYLFHQGMYYQVGDIVSVIDIDGGTYYAQIRGLLQDQYCEKSAVITWLLPTKKSPPPEIKFDPSTYIIGPDEDIPRKLEFFKFVCHAPSDYFKDRTSPYATISFKPHSCFVWSKFGPVIKPIEEAKEIMGK